MFRHDFVSQYPTPLCPDAFSRSSHSVCQFHRQKLFFALPRKCSFSSSLLAAFSFSFAHDLSQFSYSRHQYEGDERWYRESYWVLGKLCHSAVCEGISSLSFSESVDRLCASSILIPCLIRSGSALSQTLRTSDWSSWWLTKRFARHLVWMSQGTRQLGHSLICFPFVFRSLTLLSDASSCD